MRKRLLCMACLACVFLLTPAGGGAIEIRFGRYSLPPKYILDHEPGTVPSDIRFPIVYYLFNTSIREAGELPEQRLSSPDDLLVEYLGYLVISEDYAYRFVGKFGNDLGIAAIVSRLNAIGKEGRYYLSRSKEEERGMYWVPRWSWNGVKESKWEILDLFHISRGSKWISSEGAPPDDGYIPVYSKYESGTKKPSPDNVSIYYKGIEIELHNRPSGLDEQWQAIK